MMITITGTPGTGKTTVSQLLHERLDSKLISINMLLDDYDLNLGTDEIRGYRIVDTEAMIPIINDFKNKYDDTLLIFEGHLAQDYPYSDIIVVLRCDPLVLKERLSYRNWKDKKVDENVSAEILGVCTSESYETYGDIVQEVDTTDKSPEEIVDVLVKIIEGDVVCPLGVIDYLDKYFNLLD